MRTALEHAGRMLVVMALGGVAWCQTPTLTTAQAATVRRLLTEARCRR